MPDPYIQESWGMSVSASSAFMCRAFVPLARHRANPELDVQAVKRQGVVSAPSLQENQRFF